MIKLKSLLEMMTLQPGDASSKDASDLTSTYGQYVMRDNGKPLGELLVKNINGQKNFAIYKYSTLYSLFDLKASVEDRLIGIIETEDVSNTNKDVYSLFTSLGMKGSMRVVHWSNVAEEYKGQGFGAALYDAVWNDTDVFVSDSVLYEGSFAMWTKHILPHAAFFGGLIERRSSDNGGKFVLPLSANQVKQISRNNSLIGEIEGFVAIKDAGNVPKELRKIIYNLKGVNPLTEVGVVEVEKSVKDKSFSTGAERNLSFDDYLASVENMKALIEVLDSEDFSDYDILHGVYDQKKGVVIFLLKDATMLVKEQNGQLVSILI